MASTIRTMTLNVSTLSVPVALKGASERKLPSFSTASPKGHKYERFVGSGVEEDSLVESMEDAVAVAEEIGVPVEDVQAPTQPRYRDLVTKEVFDEDQIKRGVWEGDTFYAIKADEITKIDDLTKLDDLTISAFVPLDDLPWERATKSYYLTPNKGAGLRALNLIRLAMEETNMAGVALLCPKSRVHLAVIYAKHGGVMVTCLSFAEEFAQVLQGSAALSDPRGEPSEREVEQAILLVQALSEDDATLVSAITDLQADAKADLVEKAKMGEALTPTGARQKVGAGARERDETLLEAALRESIAAAVKAKKDKTRRTRKPADKTSRGVATTSPSRKKAAPVKA